MKEASCRVTAFCFAQLQRKGVSPGVLLAGVPYDRVHITDTSQRMEWEPFCVFMANVGAVLSRAELEELGRQLMRSPMMRFGMAAARLLFSVRDLYRWTNSASKGFGNQLLTCIVPSCKDTGPQRLEVRLAMQPGYAPCGELLRMNVGGFEEMARLMVGEAAQVTLAMEGTTAVYAIQYPVERSRFLPRLRRWLSWPFVAWSAAKELKDAHGTLLRRYQELECARAQLERQATQLKATHRISQLVRADHDLEQTLKAIAQAATEEAGFAAVRIALHVEVDTGEPAHTIEAGRPAQGSTPLAFSVHARGHSHGQVQLWLQEGQPRELAEELLTHFAPTVSLAIDDAIRWASVLQYRERMEGLVEARTAELKSAHDALTTTVDRLKDAQAARERLFANLNHELRTPLSLILMSADAVKAQQEGGLGPQELQSLEVIESSGRQMLHLVDSLLLLAAGAEGKLHVACQRRDLAVCARHFVRTWKPAAGAVGVDVRYEGPSQCFWVFDEHAMQRILTNLISNALKHTPAGGSITVELTETEAAVELAVRDTGQGIPASFQPRLFTRFEQGPVPPRATHRGSGIGLAVVKELTEAHGGRVKAESHNGAGTVFWIILPRGNAETHVGATISGGVPLPTPKDLGFGATAPSPSTILEPKETGRATVLIAEDDVELRAALGRLLAHQYRVILANDGTTAARLAEKHLPDLLISDIGMPEMDGLELTKRFRKMPGNRLAPVILLTAYGLHKDRIDGFAAGAVDYIAKPFEPQELLARIQVHLELRRRALSLGETERLTALGVLLAGLAHELRNPANAVVNALTPLRELLPAALKAPESDSGQLLDVIESCAAQIGTLCRQLLSFSRTGKLVCAAEDLAEVVRKAQALCADACKDITVRTEVNIHEPVWCAGAFVAQALSNLLHNAAQAAGAGGWVHVRAFSVGADAVVEIQDSGPGVPVRLFEQVFVPFFTTKPPGAGTGLGLPMARQIANRHHGSLKVVHGHGDTVFRMELPIAGPTES